MSGFNTLGKAKLKKLTKKAKNTDEESDKILEEYKIFKDRLYQLNLAKRTDSELMRLNKHILQSPKQNLGLALLTHPPTTHPPAGKVRISQI